MFFPMGGPFIAEERMHRLIAVVVALSLPLVIALGGCGAPADGQLEDHGLSATLRAGQPAADGAGPLALTFELANLGAESRHVLAYQTPINGIDADILDVRRDGEPVQYLGRLVKRRAPAAADFLEVKPGASVTATFDPSASYDLSQPGTYTFRYRHPYMQVRSPEGGGMPAKGGVATAFVKAASNEIAVALEAGPAQPAALPPSAAPGSSSYVGCTASQKSAIASARAKAAAYASDVLVYLAAGTKGARYKSWFGAYTSTRYGKAKTHFTKINGAVGTAAMTFDCGCTDDSYAYTYPAQPYAIYLCGAFWDAPLSGTDSRAGTIVHETSHFNVVASTDDWAYGKADAKSLAASNPTEALDNADSHEYFAENSPHQN